MLIDHLKALLGKVPVPAGTRRLVENARSPRDLARRLDELVTENELEFRDLQLEIEELARQESEETSRIRSGKLPERLRKIALLRVQRLRRQQDALESRMKIHDSNMNLHIGLLEKLQSVDAMEMRGVEEAEIDSVTVEFEEEIGRYTKAMEAAASAGSTAPETDTVKDRELAELEAEILGETRSGQRVGESAVAEPGSATRDRDLPGEKRKGAQRETPAGRESPARREGEEEGAGDEHPPGKDKEAAWD